MTSMCSALKALGAEQAPGDTSTRLQDELRACEIVSTVEELHKLQEDTIEFDPDQPSSNTPPS